MNIRWLASSIVGLSVIIFTVSSCDNQITKPEQKPLSEEAVFIPFGQNSNTDAVISKNKTTSAAKAPSEFGCALSTLNPEKADQRYRYQAFYIRFPQKVMDEANGKVMHRSFALRSSRAEERTPEFLNKKGVVRYLTCQIPDAQGAMDILENEMQKFGKHSWYNDVGTSKKIHKKGGEWVCQYVPGDGYGNTSSTITIGGTTYTTYYFHEECEFVYSGEPEDEHFADDPFGGGGGGGDTGNTGSGSSPNPCSSVEGDAYLTSDPNGVVGCVPSNIISMYPAVKYPDGSTYAEDYPKLTEYLKNKLPKIGDNETIVDAILKYTDLSREEVKTQLQWGEGPTVEIKQLDNACGKCDTNTAGLFDGNKNPNVINLDIDAVNLLENTSNQVMGDAFSFWMGTIILHEFVHYGDYVDGTDFPDEEGLLFEDEVYGEKVTNINAAEILYSRR